MLIFMKIKVILYLIVGILLSGCLNNDSVEDKIYGTWESTYSLSNEYFRKNSKEPIPKDLEMSMEVKSAESYHKGGIYNAVAEVTIRYKSPQGELPLKYFMQDNGNWSIHDDGKSIVQISIDGKSTPVDKISEDFLKEVPILAALFQPVKGAALTSHIMFISKNVMEVKIDGLEETVIWERIH